MTDPRGGPFPITTEQVERSPTQGRCNGAEGAIKEQPHIIDKAPPALERYVTGRPVRVEPRKAFGPFAQDLALVLDDGGALVLGLGPAREGIVDNRERQRCRYSRRLCRMFKLSKMFKIRSGFPAF